MMLVTVRKAAEDLQVCPETIYRAIRRGKLSKCVVYLPSGRIRVNLEALFEELADYTVLVREARQTRAKTVDKRKGP